jgi:hypothetical protein
LRGLLPPLAQGGCFGPAFKAIFKAEITPIDAGGFSQHSLKQRHWIEEGSMWKSRDDGSSGDAKSWGRRAADALDVALVLDRSLDMLLMSETNQVPRDEITRVRILALTHKEKYIERVAEIYAATYTLDELKALVAFLEGPAGQAMRKKQPDVEGRIRQATMEFLDSITSGAT